MTFQYFIPTTAKTLSRSDVENVGLGYAIDHPIPREVIDGPGHKKGLALAHGKGGYVDKDSQTWVPAPTLGADEPPYWVGWKDVPSPEDLARDEQLPGDWVTFEDGSKWMVPKLMLWADSPSDTVPAIWHHSLPCCIDIDDFGNPVMGDVQPKYKDLFDFGMRVMTKVSGGKESLGDADLMKFATHCLGVNYRVSLLELSSKVMGCLTGKDALNVVLSAIDLEAYKEAVGNWAGRQGRPTTDTPSGSNEPTRGNETITDLPSDN